MAWTMERTRQAIRDMDQMPPDDRKALEARCYFMMADPGGVALAKLAGRRDEWRLRSGRWRAILQLDTAAGVIRVLRVLPRGRAYRD